MALVAELKVQFTTDDVSDTTPTWTDVSSLVRSFSISRGRENELSDVDAGTATLMMDNRGRDFDPVANPLVRPLNRWWIQSIVGGTTRDAFFGYAESYTQQPGGGAYGDATTSVALVDEFKVLALDALPVTDPPRDSYQDVVLFDNPAAYWRMNQHPSDGQAPPVVGPTLTAEGSSVAALNDGAIVGENPDPFGAYYNAATGYLIRRLEAGDQNDPLVVASMAEFAIEMWWDTDDITILVADFLAHGPNTGGAISWRLWLDGASASTVTVEARNSAGTVFTATSGVLTAGAPPASPTWKHVVGTIESGFLRLYIDGVEVDSTAWTGSFHSTFTAGSSFYVSDLAPLANYVYDEVAFYRHGLTADRVLAHYEAGRLRGFARGQNPGDRIEDVLDAVGSTAARSIRTGTRAMTGTYMRGQPPLEAIREAETAESPDAVFFIAKDGTITFLDAAHRTVSPWNTVQVTFDDDGTDTPYLGLTLDYSDQYLANDISVTKRGGTLVTSTDAASIADYFKRSMSITELPITDDSDVTAVAAALLAKYKDPLTRITSLHLDTSTAALAAAGLSLEIGDRIRILHTPAGGGTRIDQTSFVQKIQIDGTNEWEPWRITLAVSPL